MSFSAEDIDFVYSAIEEIWDNCPNDLDKLPKNAVGWRPNGDFVHKTNGQTIVRVNIKTKEVEVYYVRDEKGLSNRNRITL